MNAVEEHEDRLYREHIAPYIPEDVKDALFDGAVTENWYDRDSAEYILADTGAIIGEITGGEYYER